MPPLSSNYPNTMDFFFSVVGSGDSARIVFAVNSGNGSEELASMPMTQMLAILNRRRVVRRRVVGPAKPFVYPPSPADTCTICFDDNVKGCVCGLHFCVRHPVCPNCRENYGGDV